MSAARVCGAISIAFLLSGCIKVRMDLTVASDDTASGSATIAIDKQILQMSGESVDDFLKQANMTPPSSATHTSTRPYEDETFVGQTVSFEHAALADLNGSGGENELKIVRQGDEFHVSGLVDLALPDQSSGNPQVDAMAERALQTADISIRITFPGRVISSNGVVDANTVTWRPKIGESTELRAVASAVAASTSPLVWIGVAVAVLVVLVAVILIVSRRRAVSPGDEFADRMGGDEAPAAAEPGSPLGQGLPDESSVLPAPPTPTRSDED